jgi:hypothetical protein
MTLAFKRHRRKNFRAGKAQSISTSKPDSSAGFSPSRFARRMGMSFMAI